MVVLDTSALIIWLFEVSRLTRTALAAIEDADSILISSVSIWEIGLKSGKGQLDIPMPIRDLADSLEQARRVEIVPVDADIWLRNLELDWAHRDPADRTIVATAQRYDCPLVTSDAAMRRFYPKAIW